MLAGAGLVKICDRVFAVGGRGHARKIPYCARTLNCIARENSLLREDLYCGEIIPREDSYREGKLYRARTRTAGENYLRAKDVHREEKLDVWAETCTVRNS